MGDPGLCIFGTKARSVIRSNDPAGIDALVAQQFELAATVVDHGLVPIVEPEVDIDCKDKGVRLSVRSWRFAPLWFSTNRHASVHRGLAVRRFDRSLAQAGAETTLKAALVRHLDILETLAEADGDPPPMIIFKLTLPEDPALYDSLVADPRVLRVVALSGGYDREESDAEAANVPRGERQLQSRADGGSAGGHDG